MLFRVGRVVEMGQGDDEETAVSVLAFVAPIRAENESRVATFFRGVESRLNPPVLVREEDDDANPEVEKIFYVSITLQSSEGIGPASAFLPALCSFLRNHNFAVAENRTHFCPLRLSIQLALDEPEDEAGEDDDDHQAGADLRHHLMDRSDPMVQVATDRICRAFWHNQRFRAAEFVYMDVPVAPAGDVLTRLLDAHPEFEDTDIPLTVNVRSSSGGGGRPAQPPNNIIPDLLRLEWGGVRIMANGPVPAAEATRHVLWSRPSLSSTSSTTTTPPGDTPWLRVHMYTPVAASAFVQGLQEVRNHPFRRIMLRPGRPDELGIVVPHHARGLPPPPTKLNVEADLCHALLRCPSLSEIFVVEMEFTSSAVAAARDALAPSLSPPSPSPGDSDSAVTTSGSTASLAVVSFHICSFPDASTGPAEMAIAMSQNGRLDHLDFVDVRMSDTHMTSLCSALTESNWDLRSFRIQLGYEMNGRPVGVDDNQIQHFFRNVPSMKRLTCLSFKSILPLTLSRAVLDGYKNNYWIKDVYLGFPDFVADKKVSSQLQHEMNSYVTANRKGRTTVYEAVSNPHDLELQEKAIEVLHRLSNSDNDLEDATSLFLCLQLFLPSSLTRSRPPSTSAQ